MGLTVSIDDVATGGEGIGRAPDGRVVFVGGAIPGDRAEVVLTEEHPRHLRGRLVRLEVPAPDRVEPPCPHRVAGCGGCGWQHVALAAQRRLKIRMVQESFRRLGHLQVEVDPGPDLPAAGFRTTVRVVVEDGRPSFLEARSDRPVPVESCLVAHPALDDLLRSATFAPEPHEVVLRVGAGTGERLAVFAPAVPDRAAMPADVRVVGDDELRGGHRAWFTELAAGRPWRISARSFFQTRTDGAEALVGAVRTAGADAWGSGRLADLYAGVGLFAGTVGRDMRTVAVEGGASSVADARVNLAGQDARVVRSSVERWRPAPADVVVADPPRAGLARAGAAVVAATGARRLVLVSCDAASLGRDAALLADRGFRLRSATLVDLFPHTPHVEVVTSYERSGS